jgi:hypothetical protein
MPVPAHGPRPNDHFDARTLWWRHEHLHRRALLDDFPVFLDSIRAERDELEGSFQERVRGVLRGGTSAERSRVVEQCWTQAREMEERWSARWASRIAHEDTPYRAAWSRMNRLAGAHFRSL